MSVDNSKPAWNYCITNTVNGKKYVGKTNNYLGRWEHHKRDCYIVDGSQYQKLLYRAMRRHGVDKFTYEILQKYESSEEALADEDRWIEALQSRSTQHGYNCVKGGAGPDRRGKKRKTRKVVLQTEESKKKMSTALKAAHEKERTMFIPLLTALHAEGLNNQQIRKETGLCAVTIRRWLKELGLYSPARKLSWEESAPKIIELSKTGHTVKEITILAKCKQETVRKVLAKNNLPVNRHKTGPAVGKINPEYEARKQAAIPIILELRKQGLGKREIIKRVKMGSAFVCKIIRESGIRVNRQRR